MSDDAFFIAGTAIAIGSFVAIGIGVAVVADPFYDRLLTRLPRAPAFVIAVLSALAILGGLQLLVMLLVSMFAPAASD